MPWPERRDSFGATRQRTIAKNWLAGLERLKAKQNLIGDVRSKGLLRRFSVGWTESSV